MGRGSFVLDGETRRPGLRDGGACLLEVLGEMEIPGKGRRGKQGGLHLHSLSIHS